MGRKARISLVDVQRVPGGQANALEWSAEDGYLQVKDFGLVLLDWGDEGPGKASRGLPADRKVVIPWHRVTLVDITEEAGGEGDGR